MKKFLTLALALLMAMSMTSVSLAEGDAADLTMWIFPFSTDETANQEREMYDEMIAEFEAANPGITMTIEIIPWNNRETKMLTAIAANSGPDIMYLNTDILKLFQAYGVLAPITDYVSDETLAEYEQSLLDGSVLLDGELYGLPCLIDLGTPCYNLDLLAEIGMTEEDLPTTWDEYDAMLAALDEAGIDGVYFNYSLGLISSYMYAMFFSEGCDVVTDDGEVVVDNEAGRKCIERAISWYQNGYTPADSLSIADNDAYFISGQVASTLSSAGAGFYTRIAPTLDFNWAAGPILQGDAGQYGISTVAALGVSRTCENVEAAAKWCEFFVENDRNAQWCAFGGYISPKTGATQVEGEAYEVILSNLDAVRGEPNHAVSRTLANAWTATFQSMVSGSIDFETGLATIKADMETLVADVEALTNG